MFRKILSSAYFFLRLTFFGQNHGKKLKIINKTFELLKLACVTAVGRGVGRGHKEAIP